MISLSDCPFGRFRSGISQSCASLLSRQRYLMEWTTGWISIIRDYRYVRYVVDDAELVLAPGRCAGLTVCTRGLRAAGAIRKASGRSCGAAASTKLGRAGRCLRGSSSSLMIKRTHPIDQKVGQQPHHGCRAAKDQGNASCDAQDRPFIGDV